MTLVLPDFLIASDLSKAATDNGFRLGPEPVAGHPGWLAFRSTTVAGTLFLAAESAGGPWLLSLSRAAVARALGAEYAHRGPGVAGLILLASPCSMPGSTTPGACRGTSPTTPSPSSRPRLGVCQGGPRPSA